MKRLEAAFEHVLFTSRWLMAPVYFGLVLAMVLLLVKFGKEIVHLFSNIGTASGGDLIIGVLSLVDIALIMNLLIIIMFSGYENFVSKMEDLHSHRDRPDWMGHIGFSDLKIKLFGSIVAISGIELLKGFMNVANLSDRHLAWMVGIHLTFLFSGLLYAAMDRLAGKGH
ncbi:MAG TPA: TIGR00645 family protein [Thauera sp.]|uniref:TIGR00645 family protein n=1 Tax=Thauera sp. TaxID=1905334 RepID=UPI002CE1251E|nr:TIGR00645 family protein [Thauera sp.]HRP23547.1 TIGR00645 family protein [Thauera sp.]HRP65581.1 TIGR00645 family protein [Thauera sp.]